MARDGATSISLRARPTEGLPAGSVFASVEQASAFFQAASLGLSPSRTGELEAVELCTRSWSMRPLDVQLATSSFFDDRHRFPPGSVALDSALVMRDIDHDWHTRPTPSAVLAGATL